MYAELTHTNAGVFVSLLVSWLVPGGSDGFEYQVLGSEWDLTRILWTLNAMNEILKFVINSSRTHDLFSYVDVIVHM